MPSLRPHRALLPLVPLYRAALSVRDLQLRTGFEAVRKLHWPVISIGNLSTGGAGKTPMAITLAHALSSRGLNVDVLSRGYGRIYDHASRVDPNGAAHHYGDEPLLIARATRAPVYVAPERFDAGKLAEENYNSADLGPLIHILDDGFQHRQLFRSVDIVLLNRQDWFAYLLPAGHLREPRTALHRATVIAIPADEEDLVDELRAWGWHGPIWKLKRSMTVPRCYPLVMPPDPHADPNSKPDEEALLSEEECGCNDEAHPSDFEYHRPAVDEGIYQSADEQNEAARNYTGSRRKGPKRKALEEVALFCGIARPEQFFAGVRKEGLRVVGEYAFPDHFSFTPEVVEALLAQALGRGAKAFITTEKDRVRLGKLEKILSARLPVLSARLTTRIEDEDSVVDWLAGELMKYLEPLLR